VGLDTRVGIQGVSGKTHERARGFQSIAVRDENSIFRLFIGLHTGGKLADRFKRGALAKFLRASGDILVGINWRSTRNFRSVARRLCKSPPGDLARVPSLREFPSQWDSLGYSEKWSHGNLTARR